MTSLLRFFPLLLLLLLTSYHAHADIIYFKNGRKIDTPRAWVDGGKVKCILYGGEVAFHTSKIDRVEHSNSPTLPKATGKSAKKKIAERNPARGLALEAYDLTTSSPEGGPKRAQTLDLLERARAIDPDEAEIFLVEMLQILQNGHRLGTWYDASSYFPGTIRKATGLARKAVKADPQYSKGYAILAWMMIVEQNYAEAESLLEKAYSLDNESFYYWLYYGTLLMVTERYNDAMNAYDTAMTYTSSDVLMGIIKIRKRDLAKLSGNSEEALRLYQQEIDRDPQSPYSWGNYGTYLVCIGRYDEAIPYLSKAIDISPYPLAIQFLAFAKAKTADAAKCKNNLRI
jgi:tetratricopeptide (TPR) repeat protein